MSCDQVAVMLCGTWYSFFLKENQLESFFFFLLAAESDVIDSHPIVETPTAMAANTTRYFLASFIAFVFMIAVAGMDG